MARARLSIPYFDRLQVLLVVSILGWILLGWSPSYAAEISPVSVPGVKTVNTEEARALHEGGAIFFDIRSTVLWDAGRIPGAHFMPKPEVTEAALVAIAQKADPIIFYCQGIKCPNSAEACSKAVSWGYTNVYYYRDGYPAWQAAGLEIE